MFDLKYTEVGWLKEWRDANPLKTTEEKKND
jgi:hypothetical protein